MDLSERNGLLDRRHPWEQARAGFFARLIHDIAPGPKPRACLDVGAGDGWLGGRIAETLPAGSTVTCWDINYQADELAALHDASPDVQFVTDRPSNRFDLITALDVVEHVEDDLGFMRQLVEQNLDAGGRMIVSVPAYQSLFTQHDVALGHVRRYSPAQLRTVAEAAGLGVEREGGLFSSLLPVRLAQAGLERLSRSTPGPPGEAGVGGWEHGAALTTGIRRVLDVDAGLSAWASGRGWRVPGLSYWAVCRPTSR